MLRSLRFFAFVIAGVSCTNLLPGDDLHSLYFDGLNQRGLYAVSEEYAAARLAKPNLPSDQRAILTSHLAETLILHGATLGGTQRQAMWSRASELLSELLRQEPNNPRRPVIEAASVSLPIRQGLELAWEVKVQPEAENVRRTALELLQSHLPNLRKLVAETRRSIRRPSESQLADGGLTYDEQQDLADELELLISKTSVAIAELLPSGVERSSSLVDAARDLDELLKSKSSPEIEVDAKLLLAQVSRLQGNDRRALAIAESLLDSEDRELRDRAFAEKLRAQLSVDAVDAAFQLVADRLRSGAQPSDVLRAAFIEVLLAAWNVAHDKEDAQLQEQLLTEARNQHSQIQGRWQQWTTSLLSRLEDNVNYGDEIALKVREAKAAWNGGQPIVAAQKYGDAAAIAHRLQQPGHAVEFTFLRASILLNQQSWNAAAQTLVDLIDRYPNHARTAEADLLKCYAFGRAYTQSPTQSNRERFEHSLESHLDKYRESSTIPDVAWMLAAHHEQRLQWTDALPLYRQIPVTHSKFSEASLRILLLFEKILTRLKEIDGPVVEWENKAVAHVQRIVAQLLSEPSSIGTTSARALVQAAQLLLQQSSRDYAEADRILAAVSDRIKLERVKANQTNAQLSTDWSQLSHRLTQLRIVSLAGQERLGEARELLSNLQETDALSLLKILVGLTQLSSKIDHERQHELGRIQRLAVQEIEKQRGSLTAPQQRLLDESTAQAYIATGNLPEAAKVYEKLIDQSPRDRQLIHRVIEVYVQRGERSDMQQAKRWWTQIEKMERPGTAKWIEARLHIANLLDLLGEKDDARKLLGVTRALYPQMGNPELQAEAESLWQRLD